jgi:hypothetical protein
VDLPASGYRLDEYFVSGEANVYDWGPTGNASTPQVRTPDAPYTTRITVRHPVDSRRFSGNVWVELSNPSRNYDVDVEWGSVHSKFIRDGDIVVEVTSKPIALMALKRFDPTRYAPLSMANPLPAAQQTCGLLPGDPGYTENTSKLFENGLIWDIVTQIGGLLRSHSHQNPLHEYNVKHVFLTGESQTAFFVNTWANDFSSKAVTADGRPVYDGIVSVSGAGQTTPLNQCISATGVGDPRSHLPAKHVPFIRLDSQSEPFTLGGLAWRQPDSDAPAAGYRMYEIAGAAHGWADIANYQPPPADIAKTGPGNVPLTYQCVESKWNGLPRQFIEPAAFKNMELWVEKGIAPPHEAEPLEVSNGHYVTDQFGNVLGGLRTPYVDVPIATYYDTATAQPGSGFCGLFGHQVDFSSQQLQSLYGIDNTHQNYVAKVTADVKDLVAKRWLLPEDGQNIIEQAEFTQIP